jgi:hypothetical protein
MYGGWSCEVGEYGNCRLDRMNHRIADLYMYREVILRRSSISLRCAAYYWEGYDVHAFPVSVVVALRVSTRVKQAQPRRKW